MAYDKVSRCLDVVLVEVSICHIQLVSHNDGVAALVALRFESAGRGLPVEQAIAGHRAISQLLVIKQEVHSSARRRKVAVKQEASPRFIEVAREDFAVRAEEGIVGISRRDSLSPWRGKACYYGTGEGFILGCLHHVSAQVVFAYKLVPLGARCAFKIGRRGVELYQPVAGLASETVAHHSKGIRGVECTINGFGIVSIGSVAFRDGIEGYRHVVTGGGVDRTAVATAVFTLHTATTTIAVDTGIVAHIKSIGGQIANERYEVDIHDQRVLTRIG